MLNTIYTCIIVYELSQIFACIEIYALSYFTIFGCFCCYSEMHWQVMLNLISELHTKKI